jgi:hypothetical protein
MTVLSRKSWLSADPFIFPPIQKPPNSGFLEHIRGIIQIQWPLFASLLLINGKSINK